MSRKWDWKHFFRNLSIGFLLFLIVVVLLYNKLFVSVAPGQFAVEYNYFTGTEMNKLLDEGLHSISPFNSVTRYDGRVNALKFDQTVLTKDGLSVNLKHEVLYRVIVDFCPICGTNSLTKLHITYGPNFADVLIKPNAMSYMRKFIGGLMPHEIFMKQTGLIEKNNKEHLSKLLIHSHVEIVSYFITKITLPRSVDSSIAAKFQAEQLNEEYDYRLLIEEKEAKRKKIEAEGLKSFREISNVSPVQWKALDVTSKMSNSPNSKLIITGNTSQTLPILFSDQMSLFTPLQNNKVNIPKSKK